MKGVSPHRLFKSRRIGMCVLACVSGFSNVAKINKGLKPFLLLLIALLTISPAFLRRSFHPVSRGEHCLQFNLGGKRTYAPGRRKLPKRCRAVAGSELTTASMQPPVSINMCGVRVKIVNRLFPYFLYLEKCYPAESSPAQYPFTPWSSRRQLALGGAPKIVQFVKFAHTDHDHPKSIINQSSDNKERGYHADNKRRENFHYAGWEERAAQKSDEH